MSLEHNIAGSDMEHEIAEKTKALAELVSARAMFSQNVQLDGSLCSLKKMCAALNAFI